MKGFECLRPKAGATYAGRPIRWKSCASCYTGKVGCSFTNDSSSSRASSQRAPSPEVPARKKRQSPAAPPAAKKRRPPSAPPADVKAQPSSAPPADVKARPPSAPPADVDALPPSGPTVVVHARRKPAASVGVNAPLNPPAGFIHHSAAHGRPSGLHGQSPCCIIKPIIDRCAWRQTQVTTSRIQASGRLRSARSRPCSPP